MAIWIPAYTEELKMNAEVNIKNQKIFLYWEVTMAFIFWGDEQRFFFFCVTDKNTGIVRATLKSNYILSLAFHSEMSAKVFTFVC